MMNAEKNIRAFLAIEPPEDILQAMSRLQEKLKREVSGKISWTRPEGRHLTLKFFGDVSMEYVDKISAAVQNRVASGLSLNLKVEKPGVFPDARKRVRWMVITYVVLFFAGAGGLVGIASNAGKPWSIIAIVLFLIMTVLTFVQRAVTGM